MGPIDTATKKDRVSDVIREAIVSGKLRPGERIVEMQVSKDLGVGNTAVREALFDLESKGFVTRVANKGTFVTQLTIEDVEQIFERAGRWKAWRSSCWKNESVTPILNCCRNASTECEQRFWLRISWAYTSAT